MCENRLDTEVLGVRRRGGGRWCHRSPSHRGDEAGVAAAHAVAGCGIMLLLCRDVAGDAFAELGGASEFEVRPILVRSQAEYRFHSSCSPPARGSRGPGSTIGSRLRSARWFCGERAQIRTSLGANAAAAHREPSRGIWWCPSRRARVAVEGRPRPGCARAREGNKTGPESRSFTGIRSKARPREATHRLGSADILAGSVRLCDRGGGTCERIDVGAP